MSDERAQVAGLWQIARTLMDRDLGVLAAKARECAELEDEIGRIRRQLQEGLPGQSAEAPAMIVPVLRQGEKWRAWNEARLKDLNARLARARAEKEALVSVAKRAFGRHQALSELLETL